MSKRTFNIIRGILIAIMLFVCIPLRATDAGIIILYCCLIAFYGVWVYKFVKKTKL